MCREPKQPQQRTLGAVGTVLQCDFHKMLN